MVVGWRVCAVDGTSSAAKCRAVLDAFLRSRTRRTLSLATLAYPHTPPLNSLILATSLDLVADPRPSEADGACYLYFISVQPEA